MSRQDALNQLAAGQVPERYLRNIGTIGIAGQQRLLAGRVAVVGAGGLGGHVIELLGRQGVGYLRIIDGDTFCESNLNRQLLATEANLGTNKAVAAALRVTASNSDVTAEPVPYFLTQENAVALLAAVDVVVDALDTISCRILVSKTAQSLGIPLVHAAIAGFTGQVMTLLPNRRGLEKIYKVTAGSDRGIETALGTPAAAPAMAAAVQAMEVVKLLTGVGEVLDQRLFYFDLELNMYETIQFE